MKEASVIGIRVRLRPLCFYGVSSYKLCFVQRWNARLFFVWWLIINNDLFIVQ